MVVAAVTALVGGWVVVTADLGTSIVGKTVQPGTMAELMPPRFRPEYTVEW